MFAPLNRKRTSIQTANKHTAKPCVRITVSVLLNRKRRTPSLKLLTICGEHAPGLELFDDL